MKTFILILTLLVGIILTEEERTMERRYKLADLIDGESEKTEESSQEESEEDPAQKEQKRQAILKNIIERYFEKPKEGDYSRGKWTVNNKSVMSQIAPNFE